MQNESDFGRQFVSYKSKHTLILELVNILTQITQDLCLSIYYF